MLARSASHQHDIVITDNGGRAESVQSSKSDLKEQAEPRRKRGAPALTNNPPRKRSRRPALSDIPSSIRDTYNKIYVSTVIAYFGTLEDPWTREKNTTARMYQIIWDNVFPSYEYTFTGDKEDYIYYLVSFVAILQTFSSFQSLDITKTFELAPSNLRGGRPIHISSLPELGSPGNSRGQGCREYIPAGKRYALYLAGF